MGVGISEEGLRTERSFFFPRTLYTPDSTSFFPSFHSIIQHGTARIRKKLQPHPARRVDDQNRVAGCGDRRCCKEWRQDRALNTHTLIF